jgi:hypothetical protein
VGCRANNVVDKLQTLQLSQLLPLPPVASHVFPQFIDQELGLSPSPHHIAANIAAATLPPAVPLVASATVTSSPSTLRSRASQTLSH